MPARVAALLDGVFLVIAVDGFFHAFEEQSLAIFRQQGFQSAAVIGEVIAGDGRIEVA